jgi:hypothetical protein
VNVTNSSFFPNHVDFLVLALSDCVELSDQALTGLPANSSHLLSIPMRHHQPLDQHLIVLYIATCMLLFILFVLIWE